MPQLMKDTTEESGRVIRGIIRLNGKERVKMGIAIVDGSRCDICGTKCITNCLLCGAPNCCPKCCEDQRAVDAVIYGACEHFYDRQFLVLAIAALDQWVKPNDKKALSIIKQLEELENNE